MGKAAVSNALDPGFSHLSNYQKAPRSGVVGSKSRNFMVDKSHFKNLLPHIPGYFLCDTAQHHIWEGLGTLCHGVAARVWSPSLVSAPPSCPKWCNLQAGAGSPGCRGGPRLGYVLPSCSWAQSLCQVSFGDSRKTLELNRMSGTEHGLSVLSPLTSVSPPGSFPWQTGPHTGSASSSCPGYGLLWGISLCAVVQAHN